MATLPIIKNGKHGNKYLCVGPVFVVKPMAIALNRNRIKKRVNGFAKLKLSLFLNKAYSGSIHKAIWPKSTIRQSAKIRLTINRFIPGNPR